MSAIDADGEVRFIREPPTHSTDVGERRVASSNRPAMVQEVKFDGYRTLAFKDGSRVKLLSLNLKDATKLYPSVAL